MKDLLDKGAVLQRDKETYAIAPHVPAGLITSNQLRKLADVADKYNVSAIKITAAQRIALVGLKEEDIDSVWNDLGMKPGAAIGLCVRSIKTCPGTTFCKRGFRDSVKMGLALDDRYHGMNLPNKLKIGVSGCPNSCSDNHTKRGFRDSVKMGLALDDRYHGMNLPNKLKIGVSGCPNSCSDNHTRDIGLMGMPKGWTIFAGGKGGTMPRLGNRLIMNVPDDKVLEMVDKIVKVYANNA